MATTQITEERSEEFSPPEPERVVAVLVDDEPLIAQMIRYAIQNEPDVELHFCQWPLQAAAFAAGIAPTVLLLDLTMPQIDGLRLLRQLRADPVTAKVPIIVLSGKKDPLLKAQAFACGADDYLVKLPHRLELIARLRHHTEKYVMGRQKDNAHRKIADRQFRLATEITDAATSVRSLLPAPIHEGPVRVGWRFVPSTQLGGDAFGYQWLDDESFAVYLLDVSGHDVGASLLAVSLINTLSNRVLPRTCYRDPAAVLHQLNEIFGTAKYRGRYFTIWYGLFMPRERTLTFAAGGHTPALLFSGTTRFDARLTELENSAPPIGIVDDMVASNNTITLPPFSRLFLYSDGAVEIGSPRGDQAAFTEFVTRTGPVDNLLDLALQRCRTAQQAHELPDDCTLMLLDFC